MVEVGIIIHFCGGLVRLDGQRLYDHYFFGVRYDKYVHLINAAFVTAFVARVYRSRGGALDGFGRFFVLLIVLGLGAIIEIAEYLVMLTIKNNGVGGYDNNMQDLIANLCGGLLVASTVDRGQKDAPSDRPPP